MGIKCSRRSKCSKVNLLGKNSGDAVIISLVGLIDAKNIESMGNEYTIRTSETMM